MAEQNSDDDSSGLKLLAEGADTSKAAATTSSAEKDTATKAAAQEEVKAEPAKKVPRSTIAVKDKAVLYATYMSFITGGGLFIPTKKELNFGDELELAVTLLGESEEYVVRGKIIWLTPHGSHGNRAPGVGLGFDVKSGKELNDKIMVLLAEFLQSPKPTHTM